MIEYEKETNISLENILEQKNKFEQSVYYEKLITNLPFQSIDYIFFFSAMMSFIAFITIFIINPTRILDFGFIVLNLLGSGLFFCVLMGVLGFLTLSIFDGLNIDVFKTLKNRQIKNINHKYLLENVAIPNVEKEKHDYYDYLTQSEVRLCLINEIDNSLLMAKHYQIEDDNITKMESLKKEYIKFSLADQSEEDFYSLNNKIINRLDIINSSIEKLAKNNFYTNYIKVDSTKPVEKLKLLDTAGKYKGIL